MAITVDAAKLYEIFNALREAKVKYYYGAKVSLQADPSTIKQIDCSGFIQYAIYHATNKQIIFHGGSVSQREYCDTLKLEKVDYSTSAQNDGWLRIGFLKKDDAKKLPGHVWLIHAGVTLESHGETGPGPRFWNTPKLKNHVYACYKLSQLFTQREDTYQTYVQ